MKFTHQEYRDLLGHLTRDLAYTLCAFDSVPDDGPYVILRHDVDFSLELALDMATLDRECGVRSTFFVLLTAPYYDPLAPGNVERMKAMMKLGHEIGLHYDASLMEGMSPPAMRDELDRLADVLSSAIDRPIESVAQHKPASSKIRPQCPNFRDAYGSEYFEKIAYVSDSRMHFRVRDLRAFFKENPKSQMLIHPVWWAPVEQSRAEAFERIRLALGEEARGLLDAEEASIRDYFKQKNG